MLRKNSNLLNEVINAPQNDPQQSLPGTPHSYIRKSVLLGNIGNLNLTIVIYPAAASD